MNTVYEIKDGLVIDLYEEDGDRFTSVNSKITAPLDYIQKHAKGLVFGDDTVRDCQIPKARFQSLKETGKHLFQLLTQGKDTFTIKNVPLYKAHGDTRRRGYVTDRNFLDRIVKNFYQIKDTTSDLFGSDKNAWLPKWHYGHTPDDSDLPERSCAGAIDNLFRVGDFLFGDIIGLSKDAAETLIAGKYPDRSAEIDLRRGRLLSVAALGFRTPHFSLPRMNTENLRSQYRELVSKHAFVDDIDRHVTLKEDFDFGVTNMNEINNKDYAKFFLTMEHNPELREKFEAMKDEAIQKHMGMPMGGQGMGMAQRTPPQGQDLQSIIQQVMQMLMSQKMNTDSNSPYQNNSSDVLDFESTFHHSASTDNDVPMNEEGTAEKTSDSSGMVKGSGGTAVKSSDGTPAKEGGNDKTIDSGGSLVSKNIARITNRAKHAFKQGDEGERDAALGDLFEHVTGLGDLVERQNIALHNINGERLKEKNARREEAFRNELKTLWTKQSSAVSNEEVMKHHLEMLVDLDDAKAEKYMSILREAPTLVPTRRVAHHQIEKSSFNSEVLTDETDREYRESNMASLGVSPKDFALLGTFGEEMD